MASARLRRVHRATERRADHVRNVALASASCTVTQSPPSVETTCGVSFSPVFSTVSSTLLG